MAEGFRTLADTLRAGLAKPATPTIVEDRPLVPVQPARTVARHESVAQQVGVEIARARLAAVEAYERWSVRLLERLAQDVLARELALAPVDVAALARDVLTALRADEPVELRLAPADVARIETTVPVRADPALSPGDLVVVVRDGELDARFALRVRGVLEEAAA